jgi:hypothetical protein
MKNGKSSTKPGMKKRGSGPKVILSLCFSTIQMIEEKLNLEILPHKTASQRIFNTYFQQSSFKKRQTLAG